jgi:hypothetical protein
MLRWIRRSRVGWFFYRRRFRAWFEQLPPERRKEAIDAFVAFGRAGMTMREAAEALMDSARAGKV